MLRTSPAGNPYYQLAHQYIAAELNGLNGADQAAVAGALAEAKTLLSTYTPAQVRGLSKKSPVRDRLDELASNLERYNEGEIGPGRCSESKECSAKDKIAKKMKRVNHLKKLRKLLLKR